MQICSRCSHPNDDGNRFCNRCGHQLNNTCPDCGFINLPNQAFCGSCNRQLSQHQPSQTVETRAEIPVFAKTAAGFEVDAGFDTTSDPPPQTISTPEIVDSPLAPPQEIYPQASSTITLSPQQNTPTPKQPVATAPSNSSLYAILSLEFTNFDDLNNISDSPAFIAHFKNACLDMAKEQVELNGGVVLASQPALIFAAFNQASSSELSAIAALRTAFALNEMPFILKECAIQLRFGIDLEHPDHKNPMTASAERFLAKPGEVLVSQQVSQLLPPPDYFIEPLSRSLILGQPTQACFRVHKRNLQPPEQILSQPTLTSATLNNGISTPQETSAAEETTLQARTQHNQTQNIPDYGQPQFSQPSSSLPVKYTPPVFGSFKTSRPSKVSYNEALSQLSTDIQTFFNTQTGNMISLCAADGIGKTHLIQMARTQIDPEGNRAFWMGAIHYRCYAGDRFPLQGWVELLQNAFGLAFEGHSTETVQAQISQFLRYLFEGDLPKPLFDFFSRLLCASPLAPMGAEMRERMSQFTPNLITFFKALSAKKPVVIILEDLHLADTASLSILSSLLQAGLLQLPILLVTTQTRDFYCTGTLEQVLEHQPYKEYSIRDLDDDELQRFLEDGPLTGQIYALPQSVLDRLIGQANGTPLYLEESLRYYHIEGGLDLDPDTSKFIVTNPDKLESLPLPPRLSDLVGLRLNHLSDKARYILQLASILGEKFSASVLMALAQEDNNTLNLALTELFNNGLLVPDAVNTGRFRHGAIWKAVYNHIPTELRQQFHQLVSQALETDYKHQLTVHPALMTYHAEQGQLLNRAMVNWNLQGIYAAEAGALTAMNQCLFKVLEQFYGEDQASLAPEQQELRLQLTEYLGIFNSETNPKLAASLLEWLISETHRAANSDQPPLHLDSRLVELYGFLATCFENDSQLTQAIEALDASLAHINRHANPLEYAAITATKAEHLYLLGKIQAASNLLDEVIEPAFHQQALSENPTYYDTWLHSQLLKTHLQSAQCDPEILHTIENALTLAREHHHDGLQLALQLELSNVILRKGDYQTCDQQAEALLNQIETMDNAHWFLAQWGLLAMAYHMEMGDWGSASQLTLTVLTNAEKSKDYHTAILAEIYAGYLTHKLGQSLQAYDLLEKAVTHCADYRFASCALTGWRFLSEVELALGNTDVAIEIAENALSIAQKADINHRYEHIRLTHQLCICQLSKGQMHNNTALIKQAGKQLEAIWPLVNQTQQPPLIAETAYLIGTLYKALSHNQAVDISQPYLTKSIQFYQKAHGIWLDLQNHYQIKRVREATPQF